MVNQICHPAEVWGDAPLDTKVVTIPADKAGTVIGHTGETLHILETAAGVELAIAQRDNYDVDMSVMITGTAEAIGHAESMIDHITKDSTEVLNVPPNMIGRVIGRGGATIKEISSLSGVSSIQLPQKPWYGHVDGAMPITLAGSETAIELARSIIQDLVDSDQSMTPELPSVDAVHQRMMYRLRPLVVSKELPIPDDSIGAIIGKRASVKSFLTRLTGADIRIATDSTTATDNQQVAVVTGSESQIRRAERLIRLMVSRSRGHVHYTLRRNAPKAAPKVVITGGAGNMGSKAAAHLVACGADVHVLDPWDPSNRVPGVTYHKGNMLTLNRWPQLFNDAFAVIHLAAVNPYPGLSWAEAADSIELNMTVMAEAARRRVPRLIFASSNHVMGGYKELGGPIVGPDAPPFDVSLPVEVGTKWAAAGAWHDSVAYATAKIAGERIANSLALSHPHTQFISIRIGWCQPGENVPEQMDAGGGGTNAVSSSSFSRAESVYPDDSYYDEDLILEWYKKMWLSNRDWQQLAERCVYAQLPDDTPHHLIVNANSKNTGSRWDVSGTTRFLGYQPQDDVTRGADK